jgi:hypothetical protein
MQDSELSRIGQWYPSLFTTRRPLAKVSGSALGHVRLCQPHTPTDRFSFHCRDRTALPRTAAGAHQRTFAT